MHEHTFMQAIISQIPNKEGVKKVVIEVGELCGIEAHHLKEHLEEEASFEVEVLEKKAKIRCDCGYVGSPNIRQRLHDLVIFECPTCKAIPEVLEGKDIKILKVFYK